MNPFAKFFPLFTKYRIMRVRRRQRTQGSSRKHYLLHKESARRLIMQKLAEFNEHYNLKWGKVAIRNQKTRWGSCSKKGNLNFHYRIAFLPTELQDYVIVHELCHLKVFDHSLDFWNLVGEKIIDHQSRRHALRHHSNLKLRDLIKN